MTRKNKENLIKATSHKKQIIKVMPDAQLMSPKEPHSKKMIAPSVTRLENVSNSTKITIKKDSNIKENVLQMNCETRGMNPKIPRQTTKRNRASLVSLIGYRLRNICQYVNQIT